MFTPRPLTVKGTMHDRYDEILTPEALVSVGRLDATVARGRAELLMARNDRLRRVTTGEPFDFLPHTAQIRDDPTWQVGPVPAALADRRCEITGPPTRTMTVDALSSGASTWMADFEDATAPSWTNILEGQINLHDALRGLFDVTSTDDKQHEVGTRTPAILVRPRGWRLCEKHITADGRPLPASVVDFGLMFFHNAQWLLDHGAGPYFYLPKLESHLEARLWNEMFITAQGLLGIPVGTIRATVPIETFPAAFEMEEILYELREHASGLNAGRWDYIFSYIKTFAGRGSEFTLPERAKITMTSPMMRAYTDLLVDTCRRRGAQAIGGVSAFVPSPADEAATEAAMTEVRADKAREAQDGFDGSGVAHLALVAPCLEAFGERLTHDPLGRPVHITAADLMAVGAYTAPVTIAGVRTNIRVSLRYLTSWVSGHGAVTIDNMMEDAATVEISRAQIWQWLRHEVKTAEGLVVTRVLVQELVHDVVQQLHAEAADERGDRHVEEARDIFAEVALGEELPDFFTPYAYVRYLVDRPLQPEGPVTDDDLHRSMRGPFADERARAPSLVGATG